MDEVFCELQPEPLGAASLAQVHRATLCRDGSEVAVKVQHPYVRDNSHTDMDTIDVRSEMSGRLHVSVCVGRWMSVCKGRTGLVC